MFRFKKASSSFLLVLKNSTISLCLRQFVNLSSQNSPISISTISLNFKKSSHSIWKLLQLFHHLRRNITFHLKVFLYMYIYNGVFCPHIDQLIHPWYLWKGSLSSPNVNSMFFCQKKHKKWCRRSSAAEQNSFERAPQCSLCECGFTCSGITLSDQTFPTFEHKLMS